MTRLVPFLSRKPAAEKSSTQPDGARTQAGDEVEIENDLFLPSATQLGEENEAIRNLLLDAEHKIDELEATKRAIAKLVEPVANALRAYEQTKNEKINLHTALSSTRAAYN